MRLGTENCGSKLKEAELAYQEKLQQQQTQADARLQEVKETFTQRLEMLKHDHTIELKTICQQFLGGSEMDKRQMESMCQHERTSMQVTAESCEQELLTNQK